MRLIDIGLPLTIYQQPLEACWLHRHHADLGRIINPGGKDSPAYHCVQHEKTAWLCREVEAWSPRTVVWIDLGIMHLAAIQPSHVRKYVQLLEESPPDRITAPSLEPVPNLVDPAHVCWAFCGGVLAVPARDAVWLHSQCVSEAIAAPPTWEVNTWAKVAGKHRDRFRFYPAGHNERMFTGLAA